MTRYEVALRRRAFREEGWDRRPRPARSARGWPAPGFLRLPHRWRAYHARLAPGLCVTRRRVLIPKPGWYTPPATHPLSAARKRLGSRWASRTSNPASGSETSRRWVRLPHASAMPTLRAPRDGETRTRTRRQKQRRAGASTGGCGSGAAVGGRRGGRGRLRLSRGRGRARREPARPGQPRTSRRSTSRIAAVQLRSRRPPGPHLPYIAPWGIHTEPIRGSCRCTISRTAASWCSTTVPTAAPTSWPSSRPIVSGYEHQVILAPYPGMKTRIALTAWTKLDALRRFRREADRAVSSRPTAGSTTTRGRMPS